MKEYTHIGILFERKEVANYISLNPITAVRCNVIDDNCYEIEGGDELESVYAPFYDCYEKSIGFAITLDELNQKYQSNDVVRDYLEEINSSLYFQFFEPDSCATVTYQLNLFDNVLSQIAIFEHDELKMLNKKISLPSFGNDPTSKTKEDNMKHNPSPTVNSETPDKHNININMKELYYYIKEYVIGQDEAIKQIVSAIHRNYNISNYRNKTNILLIGPSGSGKTEIFKTLASKINVPITIEDSEQYSAVGYEGADVTEMLNKLYYNADYDLNIAERGILIIDEIDKKVTSVKDDVSGQRVLNSLLSLMEGATFKINTTGSQSNPNYINFNTENLTVILVGAFSDLVEEQKNVGFENSLNQKTRYRDITMSNLQKYGLPNEILRRVSIIKLKELDYDDLVQIMINSKNSVLGEYYKYAQKQNIKLRINDKALQKIAHMALKKNVGASGIKATLNEILSDAFFEVNLSENTYSSIKVTEKTLDEKPPYALIKKRHINKKN